MKTPAKRRTGEVTASNVSTEQTYVPANRRSQANRLPANRRIGFKRSTQQICTPANRRIQGRIDYHKSAYQIPTFNTTDWYTGESAYTSKSITIIRRIRFKRITQQIGTPAKRRTGDRRFGDRRVAVSDSNVQHNRLVQRQSGVPATGESPYQIPTSNTTDWYTGEAAYRRPATGDRRPVTGDRRVAVSTSNVNVAETDRRANFEALMATALAVNGHSRGRPSLLPTRRARRPLGPSHFQKCETQLKTSSPFIV